MLFALTALVTPVQADEGVQLRVYNGAMSFLGEYMSGQSFDFGYTDIVSTYSCYDEIGVLDFNLEVPISNLSLRSNDEGLYLSIAFDQIHGENMELYGVSGWWDTCVDFDGDLNYVRVDGASLTATLGVKASGGDLEVYWAGDPQLTGSISTDISWFPDDIALYFLEDLIMEKAEEAVTEQVPALVNDYLGAALLDGEYGDFDVIVELEDADTTNEALALAASADVGWSSDDACPPEGSPPDPGRTPTLDFENDGSDLAIGITESALNSFFNESWTGGLYCFHEQDMQDLFALVQDSFDAGVADFEARADIGSAPHVTLDQGNVSFELSDLDLSLTGVLNGSREQLLHLNADIKGSADIGLDNGLSAFQLQMTDMGLYIEEFSASHLLDNDQEAEEDLKVFLHSWATGWVNSKASDMTLYGALYHLLGIYIKVDDLLYDNGGVMLFVSLYDEDDPEVDLEPPDTSVLVEEETEIGATLTWSSEDDREGAIAYSWQLDGGSWSAWSNDEAITLTGLPGGWHVFSVKSRDAWWNEDETPASTPFEVGATGCGGCGVTGGAGWLFALAGLFSAGRRSRGTTRCSEHDA